MVGAGGGTHTKTKVVQITLMTQPKQGKLQGILA